MKSSRQARPNNCKDRANRRLVRTVFNWGKIQHRALVLWATVALSYMTASASAAQRAPAAAPNDPTKLIEAYFAHAPGYQQGDLITRSQIEKVLSKLDSV